MKTPILFTDIDLCLSSTKWFESEEPIILKPNQTLNAKQHEKLVDPKCILQVNRILDETGARIVISSHVRLYLTLDEIKKIFIKAGLKKNFEEKVIDKIPLVGGREKNIKYWLDHNKDEVSTFCIIDDKEKKEFPNLLDNFVHINPNKGLNIKKASKVIKILNQ